MVTFILPGKSARNKVWLDACAAKIQFDGIVRAVSWEHWLDPEEKFDVNEKATIISRHTKGDTINIIAHSVSTLITALIIGQIPNQINKVIICGIPMDGISDVEKETIKKSLTSLKPENLIVFQNSNDPHGSFDEVRKLLPESIKVISKESSDHDYPYFEDFNKFLNN